MSASSGIKCPPVTGADTEESPLSRTDAGTRADARKKNFFDELARLGKERLLQTRAPGFLASQQPQQRDELTIPPGAVRLLRDDLPVVFHHRADPGFKNGLGKDAICCSVLKNRFPREDYEEEYMDAYAALTPEQRAQFQETLEQREQRRRLLVPLQPGQRVVFGRRTVQVGDQHHHLDRCTLWRRPGPHARRINHEWRERRTDPAYLAERRAELHSVQPVGQTATVVSFLVCPETGQRWVGLLLDGGAGFAWCYAIDALRELP